MNGEMKEHFVLSKEEIWGLGEKMIEESSRAVSVSTFSIIY